MLTLVMVAALVAVTAAGSDPYSQIHPTQRLSQQCAGYCKDSSKFSLRAGATYVYSYEGRTVSEVAGTSNDTSEIKILAKAHIQVTDSPCDLILQIRDAQLFDTGKAEQERDFARALEQLPLRFSFQDGRVEQLCPSVDEPAWVLNIKRGLLSVLQNSMVDLSKDSHLYERDVSGTCETTYSVKPMMWSNVRVLRRKNLSSCSSRGPQSLGLSPSVSGPKSTPIIKSEQVCEQTIKSDVGVYLSQARCQETHVFAPFSSGQSGVRTSVFLSLNLDNILEKSEPFVTDLFVNQRTNLHFDSSANGDEVRVSVEDVVASLNQLLKHTEQGVDQQTPSLFNHLVYQLGHMDDQQLVKLFDEQEARQSRGLLLNALPLVGSPASVQAMYQIHRARQISQEELHSWLTALAFHKQPTRAMLDTLNLFVQERVDARAWLSVSAVVHTYCQQDAGCATVPEVQAIQRHLERVLGESCHTTSADQQQQVILALKSIGNTGFITSLDTITSCIMDGRNPLEVRLAAISATRRFSCSRLHKLGLLQLFLSHQQDSELRIAAYLASMQCPTPAAITQLRDSLYQEDINQVLSFVWTHLTNLQESSSLWKKEIRQMLQDTYLINKFRTDARKFSRNYEMSMYSDILNTGATVDSNIVFSTQSYLPRSATLNLTLDLFGEAINVFEVGTRIEGFESIVEDIFSPKGYFPDESMEKMLKNMRNGDDKKNEVIESFSEQFTKGVTNEPQGTLFARVFGNELYFTQFNSLVKLLDPKISKKHTLKSLMDTLTSSLKSNKIDYVKSMPFINTNYLIPTIVGLPLKLKVNSTATIGLSLNTEVDMSSILTTKSGKMALFINPSVALQLDGTMTVDAFYTEAGVETKGVLSSNTYLDTRVTIEKGHVVDVSINVPRDKVEVVNVSSAVYLKQRERLVEVEGVGEVTEQDSCSGEHLPTVSGLRLCTRYTMRNASAVEDAPYFPLTGRFHYALAVHKSDVFDSYQLHLKQFFEFINGKYSGKLLVEADTPGSQLNRRLLADLSFNSKSGDANLELVSPVGSFIFSGKLGLTPAEKSLDLNAKVNGQDYAMIKLALQMDSTARTIRYEPSLLVQAHPNVNFSVSGRLNIVPGNKYSVDLSAAGFTNKPLSFTGDVSGVKGRYTAALAAKAEGMDVKVNGRLVNTPTVTSCKTMVRYILHQRSMQSLDFAAKLQNHKRGGFTKKHLWINLQMSELPEYSSKMSWILYRSQKYIDSNMDLTVGKTQWKAQQLYHNNMQQKEKNFEVVLSLESPTKSLDYRAELQYKTTDDTIHGHALAQLNKKKRFISRLDYEQDYPRHTLELELATPWKRAYLEGKLDVAVGGDGDWTQVMNSTVSVQWGETSRPQWVAASALYKAAESLLSTHQLVEGQVSGQGWGSPLQLRGDWTARSEDGLIYSDCLLAVSRDQTNYQLAVGYVKDPSQGMHDVKANLMLPDNSYSSQFMLINNIAVKNITFQIDLEKTLYFTSQVQLWRVFDLQLFWNYMEDRSEAVVVQYRTSPQSEVAVISMPGHYASLTVDKLGPGLSSVNITAIWGENKGSANNAILLSTFWLLEASAYEQLWLPTVQTHVHLTTPFIGFEQQSFMFNMKGSSKSDNAQEIIREIDASIKWQDQFINFDFGQLTERQYIQDYQMKSHSLYQCKLISSLDLSKEVALSIELEDGNPNSSSIVFKKNISVNAAYNNWAAFYFNSNYKPSEMFVSVGLTNTFVNEKIFSGDLSIVNKSILLETSLPSNKKIYFNSTYDWPLSFVANLVTPYKGYEEVNLLYNIQVTDDIVKTKLSGKLGNDFLLFTSNLEQLSKGVVSGELVFSSSSSLPDMICKVEHELQKSKQEDSLKESASVTLMKDGKIIKSGNLFVSFVDGITSASSRSKRLQTVIELPGHYYSTNYTYQTLIKLTGIESHHYFINSWNQNTTEISLHHQGYKYISGALKRNNDKKVEVHFKNSGNGNFRTDLTLLRDYSFKHRLLFQEVTNWDNFVMIALPYRKVVVKNVQSLNDEKTNFMHKTTVSFDKEMAYVNLLINSDPNMYKFNNILFTTTTPWFHPVEVKYDLLIDTGATKKHELQIKYNLDQEIKAELDFTSSHSNHGASFNVHSPYCKEFSGTFNFELVGRNPKLNTLLKFDEELYSSDIEVINNITNPSFKLNLNNSVKNLIHISCGYDLSEVMKEARFAVLYFDQKVDMKGHYCIKENSFKTGVIINTDNYPMNTWNVLSIDFDSLLSSKNSLFALDAKRNDKYFTLSGLGSYDENLLKASISLDYLIAAEPQKYSSLFETGKGQDDIFVIARSTTNEEKILDLNVKCRKELLKENGQTSYSVVYNLHSPFESLQDVSLDIKLLQNDLKQKFTGSLNRNEWKASITGENTFDENGIGYFDLTLSGAKPLVELYIKHTSDEKDSYMWHFSNVDSFIKGSVIISSVGKGTQMQYDIESSVSEMKSVNGMVLVGMVSNKFALESLSNINNKKYILNYKTKSDGSSEAKVDHSLWISTPISGFENIRGNLEYAYYSSVITHLKGLMIYGNSNSSLAYSKNGSNYNLEVVLGCDLPNLINLPLTDKNIGTSTSKETEPKFVLNYSFSTDLVVLTIENGFKDKVQVRVDKTDASLSVLGAINDFNSNATIEIDKELITLRMYSNVQNWRELSLLVKHRSVDGPNKKYFISVTKEKNELFYSTVEGLLSKSKGSGLISFTTKQYFMDVNLDYSFVSNFSVDFKYNVNGNKQQAKGRLSFSPDSTRIDLATPIRGFEELTLVGNLNKSNKKAGLVFGRNGKTLVVDLSATSENEFYILKGTVIHDKDTFTVSVGVQNGTFDEPKSAAGFISALKNDQMMFYLSIEGSYDFMKKSGITLSFSSLYNDQLLFKVLSVNEESKHNLIFNYLHGIEVVYLINAAYTKNIIHPSLFLETQFGPLFNDVYLSYDIQTDTKKSVVFRYKQNREKSIEIMGEGFFSRMDSSFAFNVSNNVFLNGVESINIFGKYDFDQKSAINATINFNNVKYFDFVVESNSLYNVEFRSLLAPSNYTKTTYDIVLIYKLALPTTQIFSNINLNGDYYKTTANLTWDDELVETFFHLNTNLGYGFENALLSAKYSVEESLSYSHFIDFTIDDSTLFHISSDIAYPNQVHIQVILPDSLFLPFVKEINAGFNFTKDNKLVIFDYLSGSNEKRKFNILFNVKNQQCKVKLSRSEINTEGSVESDDFMFSYHISEDNVMFKSSLEWENNSIFSVLYQTMPTSVLQNKAPKLWDIKYRTVLNITATYRGAFEVAGDLSPNDVKFIIRHPQTVYQSQAKLSNVSLSKTLGDLKYLEVYYKNSETSEIFLDFQVSKMVETYNAMKFNSTKRTTLTDLELSYDSKVISINAKETFEDIVMKAGVPSYFKSKSAINIKGLSQKPMSLNMSIDSFKGTLNGSMTTATQVYNFGGEIKISPIKLLCSNVTFHLKSLSNVDSPLGFKYETNCLSNMYTSVNLFSKTSHEINIKTDYNGSSVSKFIVQGNNIVYKEWKMDGESNPNVFNLYTSCDNDFVKLTMDRIANNSSTVLQTSYDFLKKLEITSEGQMNGYFSSMLKVEDANHWLKGNLMSKGGQIICNISSSNDIEGSILINNNYDKEVLVTLIRNGRVLTGRGSVNYDFGTTKQFAGTDIIFSLDDKKYQVNFNYDVEPHNIKSTFSISTPYDDYFIDFYLTTRDPAFINLKLKTPFNPFRYADIKVLTSYSTITNEEQFSLSEFGITNGSNIYNINYSEIMLHVSVKSELINVIGLEMKVKYGDKYGLSLTKGINKIEFNTYSSLKHSSFLSQTECEIQGLDFPVMDILNGKTILKVYLHNSNGFVSVQLPTAHKFLASFKSSEYSNQDQVKGLHYEGNHTLEMVFGDKTILRCNSFRNNKGVYTGNLVGTWIDNNINFNYHIQDGNMNVEIKTFKQNEVLVDSSFKYASEFSESSSIRSLHVEVKKCFSLQELNPYVTVSYRQNENGELQYQVKFSNGIQNEKLTFSGNCSLTLPETFYLSDALVHGEIFLDSYSKQYIAFTDFLFQQNKMDAELKWKRAEKTIYVKKQNSDFAVLKFGGFLQKQSVQFYLNDNKFTGSLNHSETETSVSAHLTNDKIKKNITVFASVQYSPVFLLTISHTVFDSPCLVEVKVDRQVQSIESAVTIMYNNLKQQAFVNIYLDGNPQYAELLYIDIWQQTHEASIHVEEKNSEVTLRGKINSPALDEYFLIATVGSNNDKIELNLNDAFIFKASQDEGTGSLNLLVFGNEYKLIYKCGHEINVTVVSPKVNGYVLFNLHEIGQKEKYATAIIDVDSYSVALEINNNQQKVFSGILRNKGEDLINSAFEFTNSNDVLYLSFHCNVFDDVNRISIKHVHSPILLVISTNSSYLNKNFEVVLGLKTEDLITGILEIKREVMLFKVHFALSQQNRSLELNLQAPLFSQMDEAKVNGIFNAFNSNGDCEFKLSAALSSADSLLSQASVHYIKNDDMFSTGLIFKSKLKNYENLAVAVSFPLQYSRDMKSNILVQLPSSHSYELSSSFCWTSEGIAASILGQWENLNLSGHLRIGDSPFYSELYELKLQYLKHKLQIGAWLKPKEPLTDYIYFLDLNDKRLLEISHTLILQPNHYKTKLIVETAFEGHEKYGIDLELQNLKIGKIVKILCSVPQLGKDLGIDFGYSFDSILNYAILAQVRFPVSNKIKMAKLYSLNKIHPHLNYTKLNHSVECTDLGSFGWELETFGTLPYIWQEQISAVHTKLSLNNNLYAVNAKWFYQSDKIQVLLGLETPFEKLKRGDFHFSGSRQIVGSEVVVSVNSNELINLNITESVENVKEITLLSNWKNLSLKYLFKTSDTVFINGYFCWDVFNKNISQLGLSVKSGRDNKKYETSLELLLPSALVPKLGVKTALEKSENEFFSLLQVDVPGLVLEGKIAYEIQSEIYKSGLQFKWMTSQRPSKTMGIFYVKEQIDEEFKYYVTLQHFSLDNDLMLTLYSKPFLYGVNVQYSPVKDEEITVEFGHWLIENEDKQKSGVKFVALHPASNTLIYGVANITATSEFSETGLSVCYLANNDSNKVKYVEIYGKKNKKTPEIFVGLTSNGNSLGVGGSVWKKDNALRGITIEARINQNDPFKLEVTQNSENPGLEAELSYSLSRSYRVFAGMPSSNELTAKLTHTMYGQPNVNAVASLRLNTSKILWGKFQLPPMSQVGQEFYNGIVEEYNDITLVSQEISNGFSDFLNEDFSKKATLLLQEISVQSNQLAHQTLLEIGEVEKGFDELGIILSRLYKEDHFYVKTCYQHIEKAWMKVYDSMPCVQAIVDMVDSVLEPLVEISVRLWETVWPVMRDWRIVLREVGFVGSSPVEKLSQLTASYTVLHQELTQTARRALTVARQQLTLVEQRSAAWLTQAEIQVNQLARRMERTLAVQARRLINYKDTILAGFAELGNTIEGMIEMVLEGVYHIKEVRYVMEWAVQCLDYVNSWFTNFRLEPYVRQLDIFIDKVVRLVASDVEKNFGEYEVYLVRMRSMLNGQYEELNKIPQVRYIRDAVNKIYQKVRWYWNYAKLNEKIRHSVKKHVENLKNALDELEDQLDQNERELRSEYDYNAENNSLTFTQELPFEWRAFNKLPEYNVEMRSTHATFPAQEYSNMVQTMANYIWQDAKLLPYLIPPFGAEALLSGDNFVTFDNSFYQFSSYCNSYLLAGDLVHKTFSLVVSYKVELRKQRELLLTTDGFDIQINDRLEVYVNGKLEDLPLKITNKKTLTVERKVHSVLVKSDYGFALECSTFHDLCKLHLDGWYMGKTGGLFGTYNNEPSDDLISPSRQPSRSVKEFTTSWAVDYICKDDVIDRNSDYHLGWARPSESMCELLFTSQSSPFYPCFHVVDPKAFYDMCMTEYNSEGREQDNACASVMGYLTKCTAAGVQLWMPEFCMDSSLEEATLLSGYSGVVEVPAQKTADVVLVVEGATCVDQRQLTSITSQLFTDLMARGLTDNRFAYVTFNHNSAQIQTLNGQIWTTDPKLMPKLGENVQGDHPSRYMDALQVAADMPYRPGASKTVVLVHCSSCSHTDNYASILDRFQQNDISLHILQRENIMSKKGTTVSKAIGLEKSGAYLRKRLTKNTLPSTQLLEQVSVPQDLCTPIMLETNGTLFNMDVTRKQVGVWAGRVAQGAVPTTGWKQCENYVSSDNIPTWRCRRTSQTVKLTDWDQTTIDEYMDTSRGVDLYTEYEEVDR